MEMLHSPQFVLFLVFSYVEMLHSPQLVLFLVFPYVEMLQSEMSIVWGVLFGVVVWKHICVLSGVKCSDEAVDVGTSDWCGKETFFIGVDVPAGENGDMALLSWSILLPLSESDTVVLQAVNT